MIRPFKFDELFEINPNSKLIVNNDFLVIDDFFLNYDGIVDYIYNNNVEIWKHSENSKNFVDYYDCRHSINNWWTPQTNFDSKIIGVIKHCYGVDVKSSAKPFEFNYFKHNKLNVSSNYQHYPHVDYDYNLLVYLDHQCNGGTAVYKTDEKIVNKEEENLFCDVSGLDKLIIKAKQNRCVIFNGNQYHGGHIDDHDVYYKDWRINLVRFYERVLPRQES